MGKSLSEIVNAALSDADRSLKIASAADATSTDPGDFLAAELVGPSKVASHDEEDTFSEKEREGAKKLISKHEREEHGKGEEKSEKKSSRQIKDDAAYGLKLATALEHSAHIVAKLANSPLDAPGPAVMESGFEGAGTVTPKAHSNVSDKITGPTLSNSDLPTSKADHTGKLDGEQPKNNTGKTAGWTKSKEASERLLRAKQAQAELLTRLGQTKAAEAILKQAQDPSSPPPELPGHSDAFKMDTEPGPSSHIPDNAGLISMTKAQAKDQSVRAATDHISETPTKDNAVAAHTLRTDGQKVSSLDAVGAALGRPFEGSEKVALISQEKAERQATKREAKLDKYIEKKKITPEYAKALLARGPSRSKEVFGNVFGLPLGRWHDEKVRAAAQRVLDKEKKSSDEGTLSRAFLERAVKVAHDPDADPSERVYAQQIVSAIKAKTQMDPDALLG